MRSRPYLLLNVLLTVVSLFARDMTIAFGPPSVDNSMGIFLSVVFALLCLEIVVNCFVRENYLFSFFW